MNSFYLSCKECVLDGPRNFYGCFYLGPFNNSQSLTIANALRRTLLSEISGLGIVSVQIEGIEHEYSTFLGIRESVLDLLLNLKEIVLCFNVKPNLPISTSFQKTQPNESFRSNFFHKVKNKGTHRIFGNKNMSDKVFKKTLLINNNISKYDSEAFEFKKVDIYSGYLQATGPGIVRASDLKLPSFLKCVDSNQYIATLAENGKLNLKIQISQCLSKHRSAKMYTFADKSFYNKNTDLTNSTTKKTKYSYNKHRSSKDLLKRFSNNMAKNNSFKKSSSKAFLNNSKILKLDPVFTPIKKVNYKIEDYGALNLNSNNQIIQLELWTNGSIHPRIAVYKALNLLSSTFSKLEKMKILNGVHMKSILKSDQNYSKIIKKNLYNLNFTRKALAKNRLIESNQNFQPINSFDKLRLIYFDKKQKKLINEFIPIETLNLPFRIENSLIQQNILTLNDFFLTNSTDLERINGLSKQSIMFLQKKLFLFLINSHQNP
uniref:Plastid-encoded RNA polymerase subunit alpha n=1 Tax=Neochloris aquatica TaxID=3099 RepID=A0A140H9L4_9CHLO|nr:alpha subunit of RNA polymerase [Neochloris aquatica]AMO00863.1 alpha subunit of RNA polymerase [Neochloris aquatica]